MKKHLLRFLTVMLMACLSVGVLAACGDNGPDDQQKPEGPGIVTPATEYTVVFSGADGITSDPKTYKAGDTVAIPAETPVREGFTFLGWALNYKTESLYQPGSSYTIKAEDGPFDKIMFYAIWEAIDPAEQVKYTAQYVAMQGDAADPAVTQLPTDAIAYGEGDVIAIPRQEPVKPGYTFKGWALNNDASTLYRYGTDNATYTITGKEGTGAAITITFYAQWDMTIDGVWTGATSEGVENISITVETGIGGNGYFVMAASRSGETRYAAAAIEKTADGSYKGTADGTECTLTVAGDKLTLNAEAYKTPLTLTFTARTLLGEQESKISGTYYPVNEEGAEDALNYIFDFDKNTVYINKDIAGGFVDIIVPETQFVTVGEYTVVFITETEEEVKTTTAYVFFEQDGAYYIGLADRAALQTTQTRPGYAVEDVDTTDIKKWGAADVGPTMQKTIYDGCTLTVETVVSGISDVYFGLLADINANNDWYRLRMDPAVFTLNSNSWEHADDPIFDYWSADSSNYHGDAYKALGKAIIVAEATLKNSFLTYTVTAYAATDTAHANPISSVTHKLTILGAVSNIEINLYYDGDTTKVESANVTSTEGPLKPATFDGVWTNTEEGIEVTLVPSEDKATAEAIVKTADSVEYFALTATEDGGYTYGKIVYGMGSTYTFTLENNLLVMKKSVSSGFGDPVETSTIFADKKDIPAALEITGAYTIDDEAVPGSIDFDEGTMVVDGFDLTFTAKSVGNYLILEAADDWGEYTYIIYKEAGTYYISGNEYAFEPAALSEKPLAEYTVTFVLGAHAAATATVPTAVTATVGSKITLPEAPAAEAGYEFIGWYLSTGENDGNTYPAGFKNFEVTADVTLTATFERIDVSGQIKQWFNEGTLKQTVTVGKKVIVEGAFAGGTKGWNGFVVDINANDAWYRLRMDPAAFGQKGDTATDTWTQPLDPMYNQLQMIGEGWNAENYLALYADGGVAWITTEATLENNVITYTIKTYATNAQGAATGEAVTTTIFKLTSTTPITSIDINYYFDNDGDTVVVQKAYAYAVDTAVTEPELADITGVWTSGNTTITIDGNKAVVASGTRYIFYTLTEAGDHYTAAGKDGNDMAVSATFTPTEGGFTYAASDGDPMTFTSKQDIVSLTLEGKYADGDVSLIIDFTNEELSIGMEGEFFPMDATFTKVGGYIVIEADMEGMTMYFFVWKDGEQVKAWTMQGTYELNVYTEPSETTYTLKFWNEKDSYEGQPFDTKTVTLTGSDAIGEDSIPANAPTKAYYVFAGWYYDDQTEVDAAFVPQGKDTDGVINVYAKWTQVEPELKGVQNPTAENPIKIGTPDNSAGYPGLDASGARGMEWIGKIEKGNHYTFTGTQTSDAKRNTDGLKPYIFSGMKPSAIFRLDNCIDDGEDWNKDFGRGSGLMKRENWYMTKYIAQGAWPGDENFKATLNGTITVDIDWTDVEFIKVIYNLTSSDSTKSVKQVYIITAAPDHELNDHYTLAFGIEVSYVEFTSLTVTKDAYQGELFTKPTPKEETTFNVGAENCQFGFTGVDYNRGWVGKAIKQGETATITGTVKSAGGHGWEVPIAYLMSRNENFSTFRTDGWYEGTFENCGEFVQVSTKEAIANANTNYAGGGAEADTTFLNALKEGGVTFTLTYKWETATKITITAKFEKEGLDGGRETVFTITPAGSKFFSDEYFIGLGGENIYLQVSNVTYTEAPQTYSVAFEANAGEDDVTGMPDGATVEAGSYTIPAAEPTRDGYTFKGWTVKNGDGTIYKNGDAQHGTYDVTGDVIFVAEWEANAPAETEYTVQFWSEKKDSYEGTGDKGTKTFSLADDAQITGESQFYAETPTKANYTFAGWYFTEGDEEIEYKAGFIPSAHAAGGTTLNVYAKWTQVEALPSENQAPSAENPIIGGNETKDYNLDTQVKVNGAQWIGKIQRGKKVVLSGAFESAAGANWDAPVAFLYSGTQAKGFFRTDWYIEDFNDGNGGDNQPEQWADFAAYENWTLRKEGGPDWNTLTTALKKGTVTVTWDWMNTEYIRLTIEIRGDEGGTHIMPYGITPSDAAHPLKDEYSIGIASVYSKWTITSKTDSDATALTDSTAPAAPTTLTLGEAGNGTGYTPKINTYSIEKGHSVTFTGTMTAAGANWNGLLVSIYEGDLQMGIMRPDNYIVDGAFMTGMGVTYTQHTTVEEDSWNWANFCTVKANCTFTLKIDRKTNENQVAVTMTFVGAGETGTRVQTYTMVPVAGKTLQNKLSYDLGVDGAYVNFTTITAE